MKMTVFWILSIVATLMIVPADAETGDRLVDLVRQPDGTLPSLPPGCEDVDQEAMWRAIVEKVAVGKNSNQEIAVAAMITCKMHGDARASRRAAIPPPPPSPAARPSAAVPLAPKAATPTASFEAVDINPREIDAIAAPTAASPQAEALVSDEGYERHGGAWMNPDGHVVVKACATPAQARRWATGEERNSSCRLLDLSGDGYVSIQKDAVEEGDLGPTYDLIRAKDDAMLYADNRWRK